MPSIHALVNITEEGEEEEEAESPLRRKIVPEGMMRMHAHIELGKKRWILPPTSFFFSPLGTDLSTKAMLKEQGEEKKR